jgi:hypothetical protein
MLRVRGKTFGLLCAAIGFGLLLTPGMSTAAGGSPGQIACNGSSELCERKLNEVVVPGSHNSMAAKDLDWFNPNQTYAMPKQLRLGARSLLFDTYYGEPQPNGQVRNLSKAQGKTDGAPIYLCHVSCLFGASALTPELSKITNFLESNPYEVISVVNQDAVDPVDFAEAIEESGLIDYIYTGPTGPWPTLEEMIASNQRVIMLAESDATGVPWYHRAYGGPMRETRYSFNNDSSLLTAAGKSGESCVANRGEGSATDDSLFLMNHWISTTGASFEPNIEYAKIVNSRQVLIDRARACEQQRGFLPSVLAVDFYGTGDVVGAANVLNGVSAKAKLTVSRVKRSSVRAGKRAVMSVPVRNRGDAPAGSVKVCASVSRKLALRPRCVKIGELRAAASTTAKIKVKSRKKARGAAPVKFKITSDAGSASTRTKLRVKPTKSKRRG